MVEPKLEPWLKDAEDPQGDAPAMASLFEAIEAETVASEASPLGRARSLSTRTRRLLALLAGAALVVITAIEMPRPDLPDLPMARQLLVLGCGGLVAIVALFWALRPTHLPTLAPWKPALVGFVAIGLACALSLMVPLEGGAAASAYPCLVGGVAMGLPVLFVGLILNRGSSAAPLLIAVAAGMTGYLTLHLHCPIDERHHILFGHASVVALFLAGALSIRVLSRFVRR